MSLSQIIRKLKKKRILSLSAGGIKSGIQGICIDAEDGRDWQVASQAIIPYPQPVETMISSLTSAENPSISVSDLASLDLRITRLFVDCAQTILAQTSEKQNKPAMALLNPFSLWKGCIDGSTRDPWTVSLGDAATFASSVNIPILTDFIKHSYAAGPGGTLPLKHGLIRMIKAQNSGEIHVFINIGVLSHILVVDSRDMQATIDSDTGPGTCLINIAAQEADCADGFDRDGALAAEGTIDHDALSALAADDWFLMPSPKTASVLRFSRMMNSPLLHNLLPRNKLSTITALTARSVFDFFKRAYHLSAAPAAVWVSGGGAHNATLIEYLRNHFDPIPLKRIEEIGIAPELSTPLALGLSALEFLENDKSDRLGAIDGFAAVVWP